MTEGLISLDLLEESYEGLMNGTLRFELDIEVIGEHTEEIMVGPDNQGNYRVQTMLFMDVKVNGIAIVRS